VSPELTGTCGAGERGAVRPSAHARLLRSGRPSWA